MSSDMMVDSASATRDQVNTLTMPATGVRRDFFADLIARVQQLFAGIQQNLGHVEMRTDMTLGNVEQGVLANPNLTMAQRQAIMNRIDMTQARVDQRFDATRTRLNTQAQNTVARLMMQQDRLAMMPNNTMMVDLGGGDMIGMDQVDVDVFGRRIKKPLVPGFTPMKPRRPRGVRTPRPGQNIFSNTM